MDYVALRKEIVDAGLLERQYGYYASNTTFTLGLLVLSIFFLVKIDNFALQLLNAIFLAFVFVRFGMLMHDAGHLQIFKSKAMNNLAALITGGFAQISSSSWTYGHSKHHSSPNLIDEDPDISIPLLAHSEKQAVMKKGFFRLIVKYQAYLWFPISTLSVISVRLNHTGNLVKLLFANYKSRKGIVYAFDIFLVATGHVFFFGFVFHSLSILQAIVFAIVNYVAIGLYLGTVFATNHKGMPIMKKKIDFIEMQVLTSRNVRNSLLIDFWTAGLNHQIEHHLFPTMPRNNLSKAKKIVKAFCEKHDINYYETGFFQSYKEILQNFHQISAVLRRPKRLVSSARAVS